MRPTVAYDDEVSEFKFSWSILASTIAAIVAVCFFWGSFFLVDEGERGILTRNGAFVEIAEPGLGFKVPFIDSITHIEIRNMRVEVPVHVYSSDTQQYDAAVSVNYDLAPAEIENIFKTEGVHYAERRLRPLVETTLKEIAGKFSAQRTIQERDVFGSEVRDAIRADAVNYGVNVTEIQVTDINFTDMFERAIENAMLAKAKVEEERNILEQKRIQAETLVVEASAKANARREEAQGEADAVRFAAEAEAQRIAQIGEAESTAIRKKTDALRGNPELTAYTYALAAGEWDGKLPTHFVPGSAIPFLNVASTQKEKN